MKTSFYLFGHEFTGAAAEFLSFFFLFGLVVLYALTFGWVYKDAESRGRNGLLLAILVVVIAWPISLGIYFAARPSRAQLARDTDAS